MNVLYKVLNPDGTPFHGGSGQWSLPTKGDSGAWTPGAWMPTIAGELIPEWMPTIAGELIPCSNGYHLCQEADLLRWLGPAIFEAEYRGDCVNADNKITVREARLLRKIESWNERTARLFACDCAERVLHLYEARYPDDDRPREAIRVARAFANGAATEDELAAAWAAAWAAGWDAGWDAARAAARAAAWAAARDAAWDDEQEWQTARLSEYLHGEAA